MKICVISTGVFAVQPPMGTVGYSGLEVIAWYQAKGFAERGHDVTLVAPEGSSCPGVTVIPIGPPGTWDEAKSYDKYWQELLKFDVVVDSSWQKWSYVLKQEERLKAPILGVLHAPVNTMYEKLPEGVDKPCFVCISQDQANHFEALFSRPARVALNGVDPSFYKCCGVPRTDRYLFLARFSTIKGPDLAMEACRQAGKGLDLVGDTSITNEPDFLMRCQSMADGKQLKFVGPAQRGECVHWFSQAHGFLHPNKRFREPMGLAPVEAQLCGCPVIAWRFGALKETVLHGVSGFLVDSLEEMTTLIQQDAVASINRAKCRDWAMQFSVDHMVDRYLQLCQEALDGGW